MQIFHVSIHNMSQHRNFRTSGFASQADANKSRASLGKSIPTSFAPFFEPSGEGLDITGRGKEE
eukprot:646986-Amorphochlora_amoeboformis.AAC.1